MVSWLLKKMAADGTKHVLCEHRTALTAPSAGLRHVADVPDVTCRLLL
jgi:hypothetical protein